MADLDSAFRVDSGPPDDGATAPQSANGRAKHSVYLVTFPALKSEHPELIDVATDPVVNRQSVLNVMLEAIRNSDGMDINGETRAGGRRRESELKPDRMVVAREKRDDGRAHYHVAVLFKQQNRWQPICGYLRYKKRLPSHFSLPRAKWWSALR